MGEEGAERRAQEGEVEGSVHALASTTELAAAPLDQGTKRGLPRASRRGERRYSN